MNQASDVCDLHSFMPFFLLQVIKIFEVKNQRLIATLRGSPDKIETIDISYENSVLAAFSGRSIYVWSLNSGKLNSIISMTNNHKSNLLKVHIEFCFEFKILLIRIRFLFVSFRQCAKIRLVIWHRLGMMVLFWFGAGTAKIWIFCNFFLIYNCVDQKYDLKNF